MTYELTAALVVALIVGASRLGRRHRRAAAAGALPNVGSAPADAEPIATARLNDDGVGTYSLTLWGDLQRDESRMNH